LTRRDNEVRRKPDLVPFLGDSCTRSPSTNRASTAGSHAFLFGGLAIHEDDAVRLQRSLDSLVIEHLARVPLNLYEYELHAAEMRNAKKPGKQLPAALGGVVVDSRPQGRATKSPAAAPGRTPD